MLIASETQSFLHDPAHKIDTFYTSDEFQPYKDNTARQLRHILINGSARWAITALTCILYAAATIIWQNKVAISELSKRLYNTITTGVSIAMGLNVASAFKDMALNMRWVVLSHQKFSLNEVSTALFSQYTNAYGFLDGSYTARRLYAKTFPALFYNPAPHDHFGSFILVVCQYRKCLGVLACKLLTTCSSLKLA
jgi:hypothetical protein